ncbi:hypothetical protein NQ315_013017 [Exocentrus adspersus]|uniref:Uncharacterized protein n=1 Tax=Exocentrus adspersus TaxID=1586481 RepID=A0AAV8VAL9_9CUCU|nr:hypothetical protein NQ315_013017 [Exocentrus adspersus]
MSSGLEGCYMIIVGRTGPKGYRPFGGISPELPSAPAYRSDCLLGHSILICMLYTLIVYTIMQSNVLSKSKVPVEQP